MIKELREDIDEREKVTAICMLLLSLLFPYKVLIAGLAQIRDQRTQQCDHLSTQCSSLIDQITEVSRTSE